MSTNSTFEKLLIKSIKMRSLPLPLLESVNLFFALNGTSTRDLARRAGVSCQAAYSDIKGIKPCPRFRAEVENVTGIVPWKNEAHQDQM